MTSEDQEAANVRSAPFLKRHGLRFIGVILLIIVITQVDMERVFSSLKGISLYYICLGLLSSILSLVFRAARWGYLLNSQGINSAPMETLWVASESTFWGLITPGKLGELKRVFYLTRFKGVALIEGSTLWVFDLAFDVVGVVLVFLVLLFVDPFSFVGGGVGRPVIGLLIILFIVGLLSMKVIFPILVHVASFVPKLGNILKPLSKLSSSLIRNRILTLTIFSGATFLGYCGMIYALSRGLPFDLSVTQVVTATALTIIVNVIPIAYMGFGSREVTLIALFASYGMSPEDAVSFSFVYVVGLAVGGVACVVLALFGRYFVEATVPPEALNKSKN